MLSGSISPLEGSSTTLGPPPWKYISSSRFDTPYTKPGIFFSARTWAYNKSQTESWNSTNLILRQLGWAHTIKASRAFLPSGVSVVISEGSILQNVSRMGYISNFFDKENYDRTKSSAQRSAQALVSNCHLRTLTFILQSLAQNFCK